MIVFGASVSTVDCCCRLFFSLLEQCCLFIGNVQERPHSDTMTTTLMIAYGAH
jgi:hypothetical protein